MTHDKPPAGSLRRYIAVGDSFTEGLDDPAEDGSMRGWADRVADVLSATEPDFEYANLAVRGRLIRQIVAEQVPAAVAMAPGLVSLAAGGNDIIRPGGDPDTLAEIFDSAVAGLRASGARVLIFTGADLVAASEPIDAAPAPSTTVPHRRRSSVRNMSACNRPSSPVAPSCSQDRSGCPGSCWP